MSFEDIKSLNPSDLVSWLNKWLKEKNHNELIKEQSDFLIDEEVNGNAFLEFSKEELKNDLKFKRGPLNTLWGQLFEPYKAQKTTGTVPSPDVNEEQNPTPKQDVEPMELGAPEVPTEESKQIKVPLCSTGFSIASAKKVSGLAAWTPGDKAWPKEKSELKVHFIQDFPVAWKIDKQQISRGTVLHLANIWNRSYGGIPKFVEEPDWQKSDIRVQLYVLDAGGNKVFPGNFTEVGTDATKKGDEATMWLDLSSQHNNYNKHVIVHEFGHSLGLGHEHQRKSEFWSIASEFLDTKKIMAGLEITKEQFEQQWKGDSQAPGKGGDYDPKSVMHYWFQTSWLKDKYSRYKDLDVVENDHSLSEPQRNVLRGIHLSPWELPTTPSEEDIRFLREECYPNMHVSGASAPPKTKESSVPVEKQPPTLAQPGTLETDSELDQEIDPEGIPKHIGQIAKKMDDWDGEIADGLQLTIADRAAIRREQSFDLQKRKALQKWKVNCASPTYRALMQIFEKADRKDLAKEVAKLAQSIKPGPGSMYSGHSLGAPTIPAMAPPAQKPKILEVEISDGDYSEITGYLRKFPPAMLKDFGIALGLDPFVVQTMTEGYGLLSSIVMAWLRKEYKVKEKCGETLTWNVLAKKAEEFGQQDVADKIRKDKLS